MKRHWQRIVIEIILTVLIELAPTYLDMWATIAEYLVGRCTHRVALFNLFSSIEQYTEHNVISNNSAFMAPSLVV